jgi:iron complex outermembrane receptor protein
MMMTKIDWLITLVIIVSITAGYAETGTVPSLPDSGSEVFDIGRIVVKGNAERNALLSGQVRKNEIDIMNAYDVPHAVNLLPGVFLTCSGGRNETGLTVRGFDLRQIPLYIDGIPVYVPYDGYVDLGRFTTFDISEIKLEKGYSSILYGPNSLGGAINLISSKTVDKVKVHAHFGVKGSLSDASDTTWLPSNDGNVFNLAVASKINNYCFVSTGISGINVNDFRLSDDFTGTKYQAAGRRGKSYHRDVQFNAKAGLTLPNASMYVLSYSNQHGEKGVPVYAGTNSKTTPRYWVWPYWDRQSLYLNSHTSIGDKSYIKVPLYYDKFSNSIYSYDSSNYMSFKKAYAFQSWYDDYAAGGGLEFGTVLIPYNDLRGAVHYKRDNHKEHNANDTSKTATVSVFVNETERAYIDNTVDAGVEDGVSLLNDRIKIGAGVSYSWRGSERADNYFKYHTDKKTGLFIKDSIAPYGDNNARTWNGQGKVTWNINKYNSIAGSLARKTRFPTIKDRYSYKLGTAIPNPDLRAENAIHYEISYTGNIDHKYTAVSGQVNFFYTHLYDAIQSVDSVIKTDPSDNLPRSQMLNVGEAIVSGRKSGLGRLPALELALDWKVLRNVPYVSELSFRGNYTFMEKTNITNTAVYFTDLPKHKTMFSLSYKPIARVELLSSFEHNSSRYVTSQGTQKLDGYTVVNGKLAVSLSKSISLSAGINNIADRNYYLQEGYPEEGRNYYTNMSINFVTK